MLDWKEASERGRSFASDANGQPIKPSRKGLEPGQFFVQFPKARCARCRAHLWVGTIARYGRESNKPEHVECPR